MQIPGAGSPPAGLFSSAALPLEMPVEPDADQAREWVQDELAKRSYKDAGPGLIDRFWERIGEWLNDLADGVGGLAPGKGAFILVAGAVVLVAVAILVIRPRLNASVSRQTRVFSKEAVEKASDHRDRASRVAAEGRWGEALAEHFRAMVRSAEERAVFETRPARTAAEAGSELAAAFPGYRPEIMWLRQRFDEVLYGKGTAAEADYRRAQILDAALDAAQPSGRAATEFTLAVPK